MSTKMFYILALASMVLCLSPSIGFSDDEYFSIKVDQKGPERTLIQFYESNVLRTVYQELEGQERIARDGSGAVSLWKLGKDIICFEYINPDPSKQARHYCEMELWNSGALVSNHDKISRHVPITKHLSEDTSPISLEVEKIANYLLIHLGNSEAAKSLYNQLKQQPEVTADLYLKRRVTGPSWSCSKSRKPLASGDFEYRCNLWVRTLADET